MTGVSSLGQALEQIQRIKDQQTLFAQLSVQMTTGKKTQNFAGLGNDVLTSQRARTDFTALDSYINNIKNADRRIQLMNNSVSQFQKQASDFLGVLVGFSQQSVHQLGERISYDDPLTPNVVETTQVGMTSDQTDVDIATLRTLADKVYNFMIDLMNTKDGDRFVFGGAETLTQPITDSGTLDAAVSNLVTQWKNGTITTDDLIADLNDRTATAGNPDALTDTIVGYSSALSAGNAGRVFVRVQDKSEIEYTALANDQAFRDVFVALAYFKNDDLYPIADAYIPPNTYPGVPDVQGAPGATLQEMKDNFFEVFNNLVKKVSVAVDRADAVSASLENARARISEIKLSQEQGQSVLTNTISNVEDVDLSDVAIRVKALETQLQASYAVTASLQRYTLVNFLSGGG